MTPNPNPSPEGVCGVCKGTRRVTMAPSTTQLGGESPCFNCDKDSIWFSTATTMTAFASGNVDNALSPQTLPAPGEVELVEAIWKQACVGREGYCSSDLQQAAKWAIGEAFRLATLAAQSAKLPANYQWSEDNRSKFNFGRDTAVEAIAALSPTLATVAAANDERVAEAIEALEAIAASAEVRIQDGRDMGARIWRLALEDIVRDACAAIRLLSQGGGKA